MAKALRYVLEVCRQIRESGSSRGDAGKTVANEYRVIRQTVMSACTRGAGIDAAGEWITLGTGEHC